MPDHSIDKLGAALQAVMDYADALEQSAYDKWMGRYPRNDMGKGHYLGVMAAQREAADGIRQAIARELGEPNE